MTSSKLPISTSLGIGLGIGGLLIPYFTEITVPQYMIPLFMFFIAGVGIPFLFIRQMGTERDRSALSDPEQPTPSQIPGEAFDRLFEDAAVNRDGEPTYTTTRIHDRLRTVAAEIFVAHDQLSQAEAMERLDTGSWTDDSIATAFLQRSPSGFPSARGYVNRIRDGPNRVQVAVVHTVGALVRLTGRTPSLSCNRTVSERIVDLVGGDQLNGTDEIETAYTVSALDQSTRPTHRWQGISALALFGIGAGLGLNNTTVLLIGTFGVGYAAYARTSLLSTVDLSATRTVSEKTPQLGDEVIVTTTIRNESSKPLPDVRIIDGVPAALGVSEGSPKHGTVIPANGEASFSYTIKPRRGCHEFGPLRVLVRDLAETVEHDLTVPADTTVTCYPPMTAPTDQPVREEAARFIGQILTSSGGEGIEFHSTREYQRGDPMGRIDWKRLARSGELTTVSLREERATTVILVIDSRTKTYVAPTSAAPPACDRGITAAVRFLPALRTDGNSIGLAALSPTNCWVPPSSDKATEARIREILTTHPAFAPVPPTEQCYTDDWIHEFTSRFSRPAQVLFVSPLVDRGAVNTVRALETYGYPVTVVSPDPTTLDTVGTQFAALKRQVRVYELRRNGTRVIDWDSVEELDVALVQEARRSM